MPPTNEGLSRRAKILKRVLEWVSQDRFQDHDSWMLFGNRGANTSGEHEELYELSNPEYEPGYQMLGNFRVDVGKTFDARRTSLEGRAPRILGQNILPAGWRATKEPDSPELAEVLDASYSAEVVGKLEKIVDRAISLAPHEVNTDQIQDAGLRAYFEEAHRCYLYGFNAACAVMCRAILESALKAKVDPDDMIERYLPKGRSLFRALLEKSGLEKALKDGAEQVKKGGDNAAHDYLKFERECQGQGKLYENLVITRSALAALYPQTTDPEI